MTRTKEQKRRSRIIALSIILSIVVVITIFLSCVLNVSDLNITDNGSLDHQYGFVLANIPNIVLANPKLVDIAMLGSHDSVTDKITMKSDTDENATSTMKMLNKLGKGISYRFAKTQTITLYDQLMQGARYFHIKYSYTHGDWYATHALVSGKISEYITEVLKFMDEHPGEIVILKLQPLGFGEDQTYSSFHEWLATIKYENKNVYDYARYTASIYDTVAVGEERIRDLTYNQLTLNGTSAGVVLLDSREDDTYMASQEGEENIYSKKFYDLESVSIQKWHNRNDSDALLEAIDGLSKSIVANPASMNMLRINQTQHAIGASGSKDAFNSLFGYSLLHLAHIHNVKLIEDARFDKWLETMPIVRVDFINSSYKDFNKKINEKILVRNKAVVQNYITI